MFKLGIPSMTVMVSSSSCLFVIAIGSLILMGSIVQTSNITQSSVSFDETRAESRAAKNDGIFSNSTSSKSADGKPLNALRSRSGRLFNQSGGLSQHQLDSYAAAYAAANAPTSADHSSSSQLGGGHSVSAHHQTTNDASAYSSFGESPPDTASYSTGGGISAPPQAATLSATRQLSAGPVDYSSSPQSSLYAGYMSPSSQDASYSGQQRHHYTGQHYRTQPQLAQPLGYPTNAYSDRQSNYYDRYSQYQNAASAPFWASAASPSGLMTSASTALSHWTSGFSIAEIVCGLIAITIGVIILGAPLFLIYLVLMGNFSGSGTLSLTNPSQTPTTTGGATTTVNGRRKRLAIFDSDDLYKSPEYMALANSIASHVGPFVDLEKISSTFMQLIRSMEKYASSKDKRKLNLNEKKSS